MLDHTSLRALFRILLALLCFCLQMPGTSALVPLQIDPPVIVVLYNTSASVNCSTNITHKGMGWEASQGPVDMLPGVQAITWTVERITHWDINPICFINFNDKQQELKVSITVYKPPDWVSISTVNHTGPMTEGKQYELQCDVQNVAPVHRLFVNWYKGHQLIQTHNFTEQKPFPHNKTLTLQISPKRSDDGAQYRCEAELQLGPEGPQPPPIMTSDPLNITVYFGPELSNCPDVVRLNEGESLAGYCNVAGNPFPNSSWERNGLTIDPSIPLNRTSSGEYKIITNNNAVKSLKVEVMYGPEIVCESHYTVRDGDYFTPNCTVVGYPPITTNWYDDDVDGEEVEFPQIMHKTKAGQYVLVALNNYTNNTANHTLEINILYPPSEITELQNVQVSIGEYVVLKCSSNANPRPEYKWIYHQTSNVHISNQDGVSLLNIKHTARDNIGTYVCIAYNDLGETSQTVRVDVQGAKATCPLSFSPEEPVELKFEDSVSVACHSTAANASLSWKFAGTRINKSTLVLNSTWLIDSLGWTANALCHGHFVGLDDCQKHLDIKVYKLPASVSIRTSGLAEPMIEGKNYTLQCDIKDVAPVEFLVVNWYQGQELVKKDMFSDTKNPADVTSTLEISPSRNNNKIQYRCEAELKLGPKNSPNVTSEPLSVTVHYKPTIREKMPQRVPVFHGYPEVLVCSASGYPEPSIMWIFNNERFSGGNLTVTKNAGDYTCIASNPVGNDTRVVTVVMKEDYLPLIAGFVALVVVIISGIFISIYSIYYKNTKMGHYTVEGASPKAQNGNVAQNGKDSTIPMKKIMVNV